MSTYEDRREDAKREVVFAQIEEGYIRAAWQAASNVHRLRCEPRATHPNWPDRAFPQPCGAVWEALKYSQPDLSVEQMGAFTERHKP